MSDETPRTLRDYRPQHDENCAWHWCYECASTFKGCQVAGEAHGSRRACSCGLDALLAPSLPPTVEKAIRALNHRIIDLGN